MTPSRKSNSNESDGKQNSLRKDHSQLLRQILRFIVVGVANTCISYGVYKGLIILTGTTDELTITGFVAIAFVVANINSYLLNKKWTFKNADTDKQAIQFSLFFTVSVIGLVMSMFATFVILKATPPFFGVVPVIDYFRDGFVGWEDFAFVIATAIQMVWNFIGYRFIVYDKK